MNISANFSRIHGLNQIINENGTEYRTNFFELGQLYFQDINFEINKKIDKHHKFTVKYLNLFFDIDVIQGLTGAEPVKANIAIVEMSRLDACGS